MKNLFKKYKVNAYGVSFDRYYFQDYIPDWLNYYFRISILRFYHILFGHQWGKWSKFSYVPKGKTGFATIEDNQKRHCSCYDEQLRKWSKKNQILLEKMYKEWGKSLGTGYIGELYRVRFVTTEKSKSI